MRPSRTKSEPPSSKEYISLLFADEAKNFYSDDFGNILKHLDFGLLTAGQTSLPTPVWIENKLGFPVTNIRLWFELFDVDTDNVQIKFSLSNAPFEPSDQLNISNILNCGDKMKFYIRIETSPNTLRGGTFDTHIEAEPV